MRHKKNILIVLFFLLNNLFCHAQILNIRGVIKNHISKPIYLLKSETDTIIFIDSAVTSKNGEFVINLNNTRCGIGLYKIQLNESNSFNFNNDGMPIQLKTVIGQDFFNNTATDSLVFIKSEENKRLLQFQKLQTKVNIASQLLLQMLRGYPISDPFHKKIEMEYISRYVALSKFIKNNSKQPNNSISRYCNLIADAYYRPVMPDWRATDKTLNDTIISHFFDRYNPSEDFYYSTNILPEKIEEWLSLHSPIEEKVALDELKISKAVAIYLNRTINNPRNFNFSLNYFLKKFEKARAYSAFLNTYDQFLVKDNQDCDQTLAEFAWARTFASILRKIEIGSVAPNFEIVKSLKLYDLKSDYTLLIFWASWCGHCAKEIPEIQKAINEFKQINTKSINIVTISLDKEETPWKEFLKQKNMGSWLNTSELKGWQGEVPKMYNIFATPSMFLLDGDKKIVSQLKSAEELRLFLLNK